MGLGKVWDSGRHSLIALFILDDTDDHLGWAVPTFLSSEILGITHKNNR